MPNSRKRRGISVLVSSTLMVSYSILLLYNSHANAAVDPDTLESIANQTEDVDVAHIDVGEFPHSITGLTDTINEDNALYVADSESATVTVIDPTTNTVKETVPVGELPYDIYSYESSSYRLEPTDAVYVANLASNNVTVIDPATNTVKETLPVGEAPTDIEEYRSIRGGLDAVYVANRDSGTVSVIDPTTNTVNQTIFVGGSPESIAVSSDHVYVASETAEGYVSVIDPATNTVIKNITVPGIPNLVYHPLASEVYVGADSVEDEGASTVSVIDRATNTVIKNITVGEGVADIHEYYSIFTDSSTIYVANFWSGTVSVIDPTTYNVTRNIQVGGSPSDFAEGFAEGGDRIYVANSLSDTVSVIDPATNTVIKNITVGDAPNEVYEYDRSIYVTNGASGSVSVINTVTDKVVAAVTLGVSPFGSGDIICNGLDSPIDRRFYVSSGTECVAKPNKGFEFSSWAEILEGNSTRTINASSGSPWWAAFYDIFNLGNLKPDDSAANLTVNRFGNFTAYFRALPPPIPPEYLIPLYGIIVSTVVGLSIPSIITWRKTKKQTSRLNSYHKEMTSLYDDGKLDEDDTDDLNMINRNIINTYSEGKINNEQYTNLKNEVSALYEEIYRKRIDSIHDSSNEDLNREVIEKIQEDIRDAYSKGKISELHYNLLNEKFTKMTSKGDSKQ